MSNLPGPPGDEWVNSLERVCNKMDYHADRETVRLLLAKVRQLQVATEIERADELERLAAAESAGEVSSPTLYPRRPADRG